jgi:hypothetical protein
VLRQRFVAPRLEPLTLIGVVLLHERTGKSSTSLLIEGSMPATTELLDRLAELPGLDNCRDAVRDALASVRLDGLVLGDAAMHLLDDFAEVLPLGIPDLLRSQAAP